MLTDLKMLVAGNTHWCCIVTFWKFLSLMWK
jgi:hypothetical protein